MLSLELILLVSVLIGFAIGRFLVVPLPFVAAMVWAHYAYQGDGDDVTGPVAFMVGLVATAGVFVGVLVRFCVRFARSRQQQPRGW